MQSATCSVGAATVGLVLLSASACLPFHAHPTRVEQGFRVGVNAGFAHISDSSVSRQQSRSGMLPFADVVVELGIRDTTLESGTGYTISAIAGFSGHGASVYLEPSRDFLGEVDAGFGLSVHRGAYTSVAPYVQIGRPNNDDSEWFVRNTIAFARTMDRNESTILWIPATGISTRIRQRRGSLYLAAVVGHQPDVTRYCLFFRCMDHSNSFVRTSFMLGGTVTINVETRRYGESR